jgi:hypothetical protein
MRAPARYYFSDKQHQFHNATPHARAMLLNGPPRLVAEDEHRVAILFSARKRGLRLCLESIRELRPLLDELRTKVPELEPYPLPPDFYCWLGGTSIRVTSDPKLPTQERPRRVQGRLPQLPSARSTRRRAISGQSERATGYRTDPAGEPMAQDRLISRAIGLLHKGCRMLDQTGARTAVADLERAIASATFARGRGAASREARGQASQTETALEVTAACGSPPRARRPHARPSADACSCMRAHACVA